MKYLYIFLILLVSYTSFAQNYPAFQFTTIKSQWDYFSIDTNFVKETLYNTNVTKYGARFGGEFIAYKDDLYILEYSASPMQRVSYNGYLLTKINPKSGNIAWKLYNNTYNHNYELSNYLQSSTFIKPQFTAEGLINLYTKVSQDTIGTIGLTISFYSKYAKTTIDANTGIISGIKVGYDNNRTELHVNTIRNLPFLNSKGQMGQMGYTYAVDKRLTLEKARFYPIDELKIDSSNYQELIFPTDLPANEPIFNPYHSNNTLNPDTLLLINTVPYLEDLAYNPDKSTLRWIDVSNREDIREVHTLDLKPYYVLPDTNFYKEDPTIATIDNNILVAQRIFADTINIAKGDYWVLWLDAKGNTRASVRSLRVEDRVYQLINPFTVKEDRCYLLGEYYEGNEGGIDLVEITASTNEVRKIANLITYPHLNKTRRVEGTAAIWVDEEHSAFGFRMYKDTIRNTSDYFYYIGVRNADLGIISSTTEVASPVDIMLYPNPASDQVTISFSTAYTGSLCVRDIHGHTVGIPIQLREAERYELSLAALSSGIYYIVLDDGLGSARVVGRPVIKI